MFYRFPEQADQLGIADGYFGSFSAPRFFRLAYRTFAFKGVMQAKALAEHAKHNSNTSVSTTVTAKPTVASNGKVGKGKLYQQPAREVSLNGLRSLDPTLIEYERG